MITWQVEIFHAHSANGRYLLASHTVFPRINAAAFITDILNDLGAAFIQARVYLKCCLFFKQLTVI